MAARASIRPLLCPRYSPLCRRAALHPKVLVAAARGIPVSYRAFGSSAARWEKRYTKDHEWIELDEESKTGKIGITTFAASSLGDIVYIELPQPPLSISAHDTIGAVESVKSASDIMSPVSGTITSKNDKLEDKPGIVNKDPEGEGWIAGIEVTEEGREQVGALMGEEEYQGLVKEGAE